jgi:hypothetical protein
LAFGRHVIVVGDERGYLAMGIELGWPPVDTRAVETKGLEP